jgi:arylsulfatase A-like enzyme/Tfp pilus assembly protein PilF
MPAKRRATRWGLGLCLLIAAAVAFWLFRPRPVYNVLLVTLDTTRADRIGCYGYADAHTPTLDALAEEGVVFESAYATVPLTLPSHASILTGLYPPENGMPLNGRGRLDPELPNLAETLRKEGYRTGAFIASVVLQSKHGLDHGFETYDDDMAGGEQHGHESHLMRNARTVVDSALAWLEEQQDRPFFCWVHLFDPHAPYEGHPEVFRDRFRERPYDGDIAFADLHVGRLIEFLKVCGQYERTLIVVVGDHGEGLGEHLEDEHGFMLYNSTLRVPLIVACPGVCRAGHRVAGAVSQVDLLPTILDCLRIPAPTPISGVSRLSALKGSPVEPQFCYAETEAVYDAFGWAPLTGVTSDTWKYVNTTREELYNLKEDPAELHNLADAQPAKVAQLRDLLARLQERMAAHALLEARLTVSDRRKLESLGYLAGAKQSPPIEPANRLPDVKDMIVHYNAEIAARKSIGAGRIDEAIESLRGVIEAAPAFIPARMTLAAALQRQGRGEEAVDVFRAACEVDPQAAVPHFELGKHFAAQGETARAIEHYTTAVRLDPHDATAHFNLGSLLFADGDFENARAHYEAGLEEFPDSTLGQFNFSVLLASRGELDAALTHARRAAELSPRNPRVQFQLGSVFASMGNFQDAVIQFEHTLRLDPEFPQGLEHLNQARQALTNR